jgi:hypothetical protein
MGAEKPTLRAPPVPRMAGAPQLHPRDILRSAKVVLVLRLGQPSAPTRGLARLPAIRRGTVFLVFPVARIGAKEYFAKQTLEFCWARHGSPSLRSIMQRDAAKTSMLCTDPQGKKAKKEQDGRARKKSQIVSSAENRRRRSTKKIHDFQTAQFR